MKIAETSQAAERTAAMLRTIPGALRGPKIAAIATNATAEMMKSEDCMAVCVWCGVALRRATEERLSHGLRLSTIFSHNTQNKSKP